VREIISKIIYSVLTGQDYRDYVLEIIHKRFIDKAEELISDIFEYKQKGDNWIEKLLDDTFKKQGKDSKFKLLWFGGLNEKTVKNITGGTSKKEVCLDLGKRNIKALQSLFEEFEKIGKFQDGYQIQITIRKNNIKVELDHVESLIFINIISTMKLTIQGGAWSEVGKKTEKALLYVIFNLLKIPKDNYILTTEEMKRKGLIANREIDAIVFSRDEKSITIELKLLGIGNPEIGDEALARRVDLFLTDRLTDMMIEEANKLNIKTIEFRQNNALMEIYNFLSSKNVDCSPPNEIILRDLEGRINEILKDWNDEMEDLSILRKLRKWTK
jgi:hypothetical protein